MSNKMEIKVFSFACCDPQQGVYDQKYLERINEALKRTSREAQVDQVFATDALYKLDENFIAQLKPLFNKYGVSVAPALFINGNLVLYGTLPSIDRLVELIEEHVPPSIG